MSDGFTDIFCQREVICQQAANWLGSLVFMVYN